MDSSTAHGPDRITVPHLHNLSEHGLAFLTELLNFSVARADIPAIWKNSVIKVATRPASLLSPHLTVLPGSEDIGAAPTPVHRGGTIAPPS